MTFVPGMNGVAAGVNPLIQPLTGVTETITTINNNNIPWPAHVKGDVFFLFDQAANISASSSNVPNAVTPAGFTSLGTETDFYSIGGSTVFNQRMSVSYKVSDGTEVGNITSMNAAAINKILLMYRGANRAILGVVSNTWQAGFGSNPPAQSYNVQDLNRLPAVAFGFMGGYNNNNFGVTIPAFALTTVENNGFGFGSFDDANSRVSRTIYPKGGSPVTHTVDTAGRAVFLSGCVAFT